MSPKKGPVQEEHSFPILSFVEGLEGLFVFIHAGLEMFFFLHLNELILLLGKWLYKWLPFSSLAGSVSWKICFFCCDHTSNLRKKVTEQKFAENLVSLGWFPLRYVYPWYFSKRIGISQVAQVAQVHPTPLYQLEPRFGRHHISPGPLEFSPFRDADAVPYLWCLLER